MMIYADTSALVKRYVEEPFSAEFEALLRQESVAISRLTVVELRGALARRRRNREIDAVHESRVNAELAADIQDGALRVGGIGDEHFATAYNLIGRLADIPLRTLDALHLAAAGQLAVAGFATADKTQAEAAAALGFTVHRFY
ncbi:MAG: type II toxin-antitoxin system VapC family toxin [Rhodocyclales bacterium]|nr:type II toxin-antitoxin system VapC family toxin [Rhodocyclales bacterium]